MVSFQRFNQTTQDVAQKVHNFATDSLKIMLTATAPVATNSIKANISDIAPGNGYTAGGIVVPVVSCIQTGGITKLILSNVTITASGGPLPSWRYLVLYNDTPTSPAKPLLGWYDYGAAQVLVATESITVGFDATNGALQFQ